jgi:Family of unknown function (DUF6526)
MSESTRQQSYEKHAHRPYLTFVAGFFAAFALIRFAQAWWLDRPASPFAMMSLALATAALVSISRVYTTNLQNRIIRLEMRVRLMELLPADQHPKILKLTTPQLVGLRFASDAELPALVDRAITERLSRDDIKKAIRTWVADWERT